MIPTVIDAVQNCKGFILSHVGIPIMFKNTPEELQFVINWDPDGALPSFPVVITIPPDNYTIDSLLLIIQTELNTELKLDDADASLSVTLVNERVVFESTGISPGTIQVPQQVDSILDEMLGISIIDAQKGFESPNAMTNAPDLFGVRDILITSNILSDYTGTIETDGKYLATVAHIPVEEEYGCFQVYNTRQIELEGIAYPHIKNITQFDVQVRDDAGNILDIQGLNWEMTLKLYY
jgi:hypothetical protein